MYVVLFILHKYPGEGKDHFQAKPCQSSCPRETLDRTCVFGKHGLGSLIPPRYMLCLCMCGLSSREKSPHPRVRCLRAPACKGVISSFREFGTSHHLTAPCVVNET